MVELMRFCLTPVHICIGRTDGFLATTDKSVVDAQLPNVNVLSSEDGNAIFYYINEIPDNFQQITQKL